MSKDTLICYLSKYGVTERYAGIIASQLDGETRDLQTVSKKEVEEAKRIIIGAPIFAGKPPRALKRFCERHRTLLLEKEVGLYLSCMVEGEKGKLQVERAFPDWLVVHAKHSHVLGGEIILSKLSGFYRFIIVKMVKQKEDKSMFSEEKARDFASHFQS